MWYPQDAAGDGAAALLRLGTLRKLIIHLETAEAKQNLYKRITADCICKHTHKRKRSI